MSKVIYAECFTKIQRRIIKPKIRSKEITKESSASAQSLDGDQESEKKYEHMCSKEKQLGNPWSDRIHVLVKRDRIDCECCTSGCTSEVKGRRVETQAHGHHIRNTFLPRGMTMSMCSSRESMSTTSARVFNVMIASEGTLHAEEQRQTCSQHAFLSKSISIGPCLTGSQHLQEQASAQIDRLLARE